MPEVHGIGARTDDSDQNRQQAVHVEAGAATPDGERVEEDRIHRKRYPSGDQDGPVPPPDPIASRVEDWPEQARRADPSGPQP